MVSLVKILMNAINCDDNASCINNLGSFECSCKNGFSGNGRNCVDVNECAISDACNSTSSTCFNTLGRVSFKLIENQTNTCRFSISIALFFNFLKMKLVKVHSAANVTMHTKKLETNVGT